MNNKLAASIKEAKGEALTATIDMALDSLLFDKDTISTDEFEERTKYIRFLVYALNE